MGKKVAPSKKPAPQGYEAELSLRKLTDPFPVGAIGFLAVFRIGGVQQSGSKHGHFVIEKTGGR